MSGSLFESKPLVNFTSSMTLPDLMKAYPLRTSPQTLLTDTWILLERYCGGEGSVITQTFNLMREWRTTSHNIGSMTKALAACRAFKTALPEQVHLQRYGVMRILGEALANIQGGYATLAADKKIMYQVLTLILQRVGITTEILKFLPHSSYDPKADIILHVQEVIHRDETDFTKLATDLVAALLGIHRQPTAVSSDLFDDLPNTGILSWWRDNAVAQDQKLNRIINNIVAGKADFWSAPPRSAIIELLRALKKFTLQNPGYLVHEDILQYAMNCFPELHVQVIQHSGAVTEKSVASELDTFQLPSSLINRVSRSAFVTNEHNLLIGPVIKDKFKMEDSYFNNSHVILADENTQECTGVDNGVRAWCLGFDQCLLMIYYKSNSSRSSKVRGCDPGKTEMKIDCVTDLIRVNGRVYIKEVTGNIWDVTQHKLKEVPDNIRATLQWGRPNYPSIHTLQLDPGTTDSFDVCHTPLFKRKKHDSQNDQENVMLVSDNTSHFRTAGTSELVVK